MERWADGEWAQPHTDGCGQKRLFVVCGCGYRSVVMRVISEKPMCNRCLQNYRRELGYRFNDALSGGKVGFHETF